MVAADDLVGRWSTFCLYLGSLQDSQLYFMANGVGWTEFWNGGGSEQHRFHWTVQGDHLTLEINRYAWVELVGTDYASPVLREQHETVGLTFGLRLERDAYGDERTVLNLDRAISFSQRFAYMGRELSPDDDRVGWALR